MESFLEIFGEDRNILPESFKHECKILVFGYGSILWKPEFQYGCKRRGYITRFQRKFWQGNITHRGTTDKPGRCATLVPSLNESERVCGVAYEVRGYDLVKKAWDSLYSRECKSGGYTVEVTSFHPFDCQCPPEPVLVFRATPKCYLYKEESPEDEIAIEIFDSKRPSGTNIEYVVLLCKYMEKYMPDGADDHLLKLVKNFKIIAKQKGTNLDDYVVASIPACEEFTPCGVGSHLKRTDLVSETRDCIL